MKNMRKKVIDTITIRHPNGIDSCAFDLYRSKPNGYVAEVKMSTEAAVRTKWFRRERPALIEIAKMIASSGWKLENA